jgi:hypothetical protein
MVLRVKIISMRGCKKARQEGQMGALLFIGFTVAIAAALIAYDDYCARE